MLYIHTYVLMYISYYCCNSCHLIVVVVITDPGIKVDHGYKPYDDGIAQGVFIKVRTYLQSCVSSTCLIPSPNTSCSKYEANLYSLILIIVWLLHGHM